MNDDIRGSLSRALPETLPAPRIELESLEAQGEARLRRRRFGFAGLATAGVAVVAAFAVALPSAFATTNTTPAADDESDSKPDTQQQAYPLPDLETGTNYEWSTPPPDEEVVHSSAAAKKLSTQFWKYLTQKYPDLKVPDMREGYDSGNPKFLDPADFPTARRNVDVLAKIKKDSNWPQGYGTEDLIPTDYRKPVYEMTGESYAQLEPEAEYLNSFSVAVHPKGSYAAEPKSIPDFASSTPMTPHLVPGCKDGIGSGQGGTQNFGYEYVCEKTTGPDGETIYKVEQTINGGNEDPAFISSRKNFVVVTLANGNAVVVGDAVDSSVDNNESGQDMKPEMSCDALAKLALALPQVVVE